ncbi:MAG: AAA family ATPase [Crocinitomicaceae bacterium]|nr:AAA family ATPase [Crocinitomicaceae bacterium]
MLCRLEVSNYALIENVDLTLEKGFTVITGETGAGKSILLKALQLLLGERSDSGVLKNSEKKCFLEATFDVSALKLESFFEEHELDFDKRCIIRREFSSAGKSRCFINDTPVQLNILKTLGENLISIHSQHETLSLFDTGFQFDVVDYFAGIQNEVSAYKKNYRQYKELLRQLEILEDTEARNRKERDFKSFLLK